MVVYSMKTAKNGRVLYFADGKLVAKNRIPETAVIHDKDFIIEEPAAPVAAVTPEPETEERFCVACDGPGERRRFLNMQTVWLCEDHYQTLTLGEVAQALRERQVA